MVEMVTGGLIFCISVLLFTILLPVSLNIFRITSICFKFSFQSCMDTVRVIYVTRSALYSVVDTCELSFIGWKKIVFVCNKKANKSKTIRSSSVVLSLQAVYGPYCGSHVEQFFFIVAQTNYSVCWFIKMFYEFNEPMFDALPISIVVVLLSPINRNMTFCKVLNR